MDYSLQNAIRKGDFSEFVDLFSKIEDPSKIWFNTWMDKQSMYSYVLYYQNPKFLNFLLNHPQASGFWKDDFEMSYAIIFLPDAIPMLIQHGFDINMMDKRGILPIEYAVAYNKIDVIKILLDYRVNIDTIFEDGNTLLHVACELRTGNFCYLCLEFLLARMDSKLIFLQNTKGETFLDIYIKSKFICFTDDTIIYKHSENKQRFSDIMSMLYKLVNSTVLHKHITRKTQHLIDWGVRAGV